MSPWSDFKNIRKVDVVPAQGGGHAVHARSPLGFHFWLKAAEGITHEKDKLQEIADGLNRILESSTNSQLRREGWELIGVERGSPAARAQDETLIRLAADMSRGLGGGKDWREGRA